MSMGGAALDQEEDQEDEDEDEEEDEGRVAMQIVAEGAGTGTDIVLHEDKKYYPTAEEVYGPGTETLVQEEDAQPLEVPIIAPVLKKQIEVEAVESKTAVPVASVEFLSGLLSTPQLVRNVAVMGHLHHGKTVLMDMLVQQTHDIPGVESRGPDNPIRFTDTRLDEQTRGISLKAVPMSLVLENSDHKSYAINLIDTPGHPNFSDEACAAARLSDGALLVVDAVEGVMLGTEHAVKIAAAEGLSLCLVITKLDRLITELKLPPTDAYHKLRHTIQEVNALVSAAYGGDPAMALDPVLGNVAFSAPLYGWSFTLHSFARLYADLHEAPMDPVSFASRLWGDVWFHEDSRTFRRQPPPQGGGGERSFIQFVLEPLYKMYSRVLGESEDSVAALAEELGVMTLEKDVLGSDVKPLLKHLLSRIFGTATGLVDMMVKRIPSARSGTMAKVERWYTGPQTSGFAQAIRACSPTGPLALYVCKLFPKSDCSSFDVFARVISGTVKPGMRVRVLGEAYTPDDEEDSVVATVSAVWVYQARYRVPLTSASAGAWVLIQGLDATVFKTATIVSEFLPNGKFATGENGDFVELGGGEGEEEEEVYIFKPLTLDREAKAVVKIAAEPLNPGELPKMVEGLRLLSRSYPALTTKVEESGEHTIFGTGELYLDSAMKDLRELYADVEIKVADPVVSFCETIMETSSLKCFADSQNRKVRLTAIAEPLDKGLGEDIEAARVSLEWPRKQISQFFKEKYDWDALAAKSVWAFGPNDTGPNVLLDDTLAAEVDKKMVLAIRESVVQGFQWGAREGPLCDEPMRNVKFKLTDAIIPENPIERGAGQVIPTARRVCLSSFLMATPRLMEPVYYVEIQTPSDCISAIYTVLAKRRGHVVADVPKPGTPIFIVKAYLPIIESFGFETDLRYHTQGQAFCLTVFDHWQIVPGDPLDKSIVLRPLEPAPMQSLARDFVVKTRRRKGMTDDISVTKFFDDPMLAELATQDEELRLIF